VSSPQQWNTRPTSQDRQQRAQAHVVPHHVAVEDVRAGFDHPRREIHHVRRGLGDEQQPRPGLDLRIGVPEDDAGRKLEALLDQPHLAVLCRGDTAGRQSDGDDGITDELRHQRERADAHAHGDDVGLRGHVADGFDHRLHSGSKTCVDEALRRLEGAGPGGLGEVEGGALLNGDAQRLQQVLLLELQVHHRQGEWGLVAGGAFTKELAQFGSVQQDTLGVYLLAKYQVGADGDDGSLLGELQAETAVHARDTPVIHKAVGVVNPRVGRLG